MSGEKGRRWMEGQKEGWGGDRNWGEGSEGSEEGREEREETESVLDHLSRREKLRCCCFKGEKLQSL